MSFNAIRENKILAKISGITVINRLLGMKSDHVKQITDNCGYVS